MAASMRDLKERIRSAESTGKITKSMKMVSAAKLRRTQNAMQQLRPFAEKSGQVLAEVLASAGRIEQPLMKPNGAEKVCYVLLLGNRGLCGVYNSSLLRYYAQQAENEPDYTTLVVGRWGRDRIHSLGLNVLDMVDEVSDTPDSAAAEQLADKLKELYLSGEVRKIVLVYQAFRSVLAQTPCSKTLLPVQLPQRTGGGGERIFEPDRERIIDELADQYLLNTVYSAMLEAKAGEHAARMTAMTTATDNTEELIADLSLKLNHARQAAITTEITEIVGGASALNRNA